MPRLGPVNSGPSPGPWHSLRRNLGSGFGVVRGGPGEAASNAGTARSLRNAANQSFGCRSAGPARSRVPTSAAPSSRGRHSAAWPDQGIRLDLLAVEGPLLGRSGSSTAATGGGRVRFRPNSSLGAW